MGGSPLCWPGHNELVLGLRTKLDFQLINEAQAGRPRREGSGSAGTRWAGGDEMQAHPSVLYQKGICLPTRFSENLPHSNGPAVTNTAPQKVLILE